MVGLKMWYISHCQQWQNLSSGKILPLYYDAFSGTSKLLGDGKESVKLWASVEGKTCPGMNGEVLVIPSSFGFSVFKLFFF